MRVKQRIYKSANEKYRQLTEAATETGGILVNVASWGGEMGGSTGAVGGAGGAVWVVPRSPSSSGRNMRL